MKPITWSFGNQSRAPFHVGEHPAIAEAVKTARNAGMTEAIIFGKDHTGFCFHPTKYGVTHPNLKINLTGNITAELHKLGMKSIAYVNFGMDGEMGRKHRDWLQENTPGHISLLTEDHYADLCPFTPYLDQYLMPVVKEIIDDYDVDGIFFDTMSAYHYCVCKTCRDAFKNTFGKELPLLANPDDPSWKLYGPWQYERMCKSMEYVRTQIKAWKPDAIVIFNHMGGPSYPMPLPGVLEGTVSCDPPAFFPWISLYSNYMSSLPKPGDVFIERFARGWADRCSNDHATMQYKSAIIFAYRQRFCVGDRMHPDCRMGAGSAKAMKIISDVWKVFNRQLPDSMEHACDFLLLFPECFCTGFARQNFMHHAGFATRDELNGAYRMLLDCGRAFTVVPEMTLEHNLKKGRTLIIHSTAYLKQETNQIIENFINNGGTVLVSSQLPMLDDGSFVKWCGLRSISPLSQETNREGLYLPDLGNFRTPKDDERLLVRGPVRQITLSSAKALLYPFPQDFVAGLKKSNGTYYNSSSSTPMDTPILTSCKFGKGKVFFLNCAILDDYLDSALPGHKRWFNEVLSKVTPKPEFFLESPSGDVELVSYKNGDASTHVLINHGGRKNSLKHLYASEQIVLPQPPYQVTLKVRSKTAMRFNTTDGYAIPKMETDNMALCINGYAEIPVVMDKTWKFINIKPF